MSVHELQYDAALQGSNVWRFTHTSDPRLIDLELVVRLGPAGETRPIWVAYRTNITSRGVPAERPAPALLFVSEGVWRSEPCVAEFQRVPKGTAFLFKGAPPELTP